MINRKFLLLLIVLLAFSGTLYSCKPDEPADIKTANAAYPPQYSQEWGQVYDYILKNWGRTIVTNKNLPNPFLAAWKESPTYFYFDNYIINKGAFEVDTLSRYAKNAVDDAISLINKLGFVPNFTGKDGEDRSQVPYLSMAVRDVYNHMTKKDTAWLMKAYNALRKEYHFWTDTTADAIEDHTTPIPHLQHFGQHATREQLISFYNRVLVSRIGVNPKVSDNKKAQVAIPYMAEAESMDFTPRYDNRCPDFAAVDLNTCLYLYEKNFVWMEKVLGIKNNIDWLKRANERKEQMQKYLWDKKRGLYMDYDYVSQRFGKIACITSVLPLYAGMATKQQAQDFVDNLPLFEFKYGISVTEKNDAPSYYQWNYPGTWGAFVVFTVEGLDRYGYKKQARRIASKWLDLVTRNYIKPIPEPKQSGHFLYEKYNAVNGDISSAGYGMNKFFGFTAGSYVWCYNYLRQSNPSYP